MSEQLALTELHVCTTCDGRGTVPDRETGETVRCPTCLGTGSLSFDPEDYSEIPY